MWYSESRFCSYIFHLVPSADALFPDPQYFGNKNLLYALMTCTMAFSSRSSVMWCRLSQATCLRLPARFDEGRKLCVLPVGIDHDVGVCEHIWERGVGLK